MSSPESTKQRALRIELDHHKRPEPLSVVKWVLAIGAAVASMAYAGYVYLPGSNGQTQFSPGDVSAVHASLNHRCSECHQNFEPIRGDAWSASAGSSQASDARCQECHAGPAHHANISPSSPHGVESCGGCHQDHQGAEASLLRMGDEHCTRCHARLDTVVSERSIQPDIDPVTAFVAAHSQSQPPPHPPFRSLKQDPGTVKFNHALHMTRGLPQPSNSGAGRALSQYEQISDKQYLARAVPEWKEGLTGAVQLACSSCHQAEPLDDQIAAGAKKGAVVSFPPANGAYMAPVNFEQHCGACHTLNVGPRQADSIPHGLTAAALEELVLVKLAGKPQSKPETDPKKRLESLLGKSEEDFIAGQLADKSSAPFIKASEHLTTTCMKCHAFEKSGSAFTADVAASNIPAAWFKHAKFDHAAHRAVYCLHCHQQATESTRSADVIISGYESCAECHRPVDAAPPASAVGQRFQGARSDCVECHTYHAGEFPVTGVGSLLRGPLKAAKEPQ